MNRYSRLLDLSSFSKEKLSILNNQKILLIGVGGVGQNIATYLITNGVLNLTIIDFDEVEISNLNRQFLLTEEDIGKTKVDVVKDALENRNKEAIIKSYDLKVDISNINKLIEGYDYVIDAVDNWESKLVIARACKEKHLSLLHVGVDGHSGQYCLFKNKSLLDIVDEKILSSRKDGVMGPMVSLISSLASILLLENIVNNRNDSDVLYSFDYKSNQLTKIVL